MENFFVGKINLSDRHTDTQKIDVTPRFGEFTEIDGRKQERITITLELYGSGDTTKISDIAIIETISQKLGIGIL